LGKPRVPLLASALAVVTNVVINLLFFARVGFRAVALGTAVGSLVNVAVLLAVFERRVGGLGGRGWPMRLLRILGATAVMAVVSWLLAQRLEAWLGSQGLLAHLATGLLPVVVGVLVYGLAAYGLKVPEAGAVLGLLKGASRRDL
jgi:peptidoglycan biosynthesis protein MviN/MurJ (putative lipid II flippase)